MQIENNVFVVTGAGNGIGREVALILLSRGARVAAVDLNAAGLAETVALSRNTSHVSTHELDVSDRAAVLDLPAEVIAAHGQVDGLFNIAGIIQPFTTINDTDFAVIEKLMNVNFWGVVSMTKAFLPELLKRPSAGILNVSSVGGYVPVPGTVGYGTSKAAVKIFTETLYAELQGTSVAVTGVFPGGVRTNIAANSGVDVTGTDRLTRTKPTDAGQRIVRAMERGSFRITIGPDAKILDVLMRINIKRSILLVASQTKALLEDRSHDATGQDPVVH